MPPPPLVGDDVAVRVVPPTTTGSREVEPSRKRHRRQSPSDRRRKARRHQDLIDTVSRERQEAWAESGRPVVVELLTEELGTLHARKREMGHESYAEVSKLEGQDVIRLEPRPGA